MLPKFIIIGAMKSGTTSLYNYLATHPDIVASSIKETDFFKTDIDFHKGIDWYKSLFKGKGKYAFEASTNYTKRHQFPDVAKRMHTIVPDIKLLYVVRDPIERTISNYIHNFVQRIETRSLSQIIDDSDSGYLQTSKYYFQLQAFLEYYHEDQIHLVQSEQLNSNPGNALSDICKFLEIDFEFDATILAKRYNISSNKRVRSSLELKVIDSTNNQHMKTVIRKITRLFKKPIVKPFLTEKDKALLRAIFVEDVKNLRFHTGCEFRGWSL